METVLLLLIALPLAGGVINGVVGERLPRRIMEAIACGAVVGAFAMAAAAFAMSGSVPYDVSLWNWFAVGRFFVSMSIHYDALAAIMALMVTLVSSLIHLYSVQFMREDNDATRFFCYLNLFVFAMLVITLADNLVFLYLGWEGVGFCSYALIGFWYSDEQKASAGRKAFLLTRIGDVGFGIALGLLYAVFHSLSITVVVSHTAILNSDTATLLGLLLIWAAVGKSAQLPLTVWLPDAMAGPTPVSALIHAATMVTAGVYLLMRLFPVLALSPDILFIIAVVGAATAFYSACAALAQWDIKRVLAYSTMSQVSYMFLGVGVGDIVGSMFLLLSHAFFKSLLFLCAGCIIQAFHEEHSIYRMGSLRQRLPMVYPLFLIGSLALSAFPLIGGYFSKDRILMATFIHPEFSYKVLWLVAAVGALLTPLYTMRMFFIASAPQPGNLSETRPIPKFMQLILWPLALLSLFDGCLNLPGGAGKRWLAHYLSGVPGAIVDLGTPKMLDWAMAVGDAVLVVAVVVLAYILFRRPMPQPPMQGFYQVLFSGLYLDRLYQLLIVRPYIATARFLWVTVDMQAIDNGIEKVGTGLCIFSRGLTLWANGKISTYLRMLLTGLAAFLLLLWTTSHFGAAAFSDVKLLFLGFSAILCVLLMIWHQWQGR